MVHELSNNAPPQSIVITGTELEMLTEEQEDVLCTYQEVIFTCMTLEQKLHIVCSMQARSGVVGITGDSVNDAPTLCTADCGIAMGSGSDVVHEVADMVLLEDFLAIVVALEYSAFFGLYHLSCALYIRSEIVNLTTHFHRPSGV